MTDTISSLFEAIQSYFLDREQELLANITFEVEALQETTSCTLRLTLFFTLLFISLVLLLDPRQEVVAI